MSNEKNYTPGEDLQDTSGGEEQQKVYTLNLSFNADDETEVERKYRFYKPRAASYERYMKNISSSLPKSSKVFTLDNVHPDDKAALEKDIKEYPALAISISSELMGMLGMTKTTNLIKS